MCVPLRNICKERCRSPYRLSVGKGTRRPPDKCPDGRTCKGHAWCLKNKKLVVNNAIIRYIHQVSVLLVAGFGGLLAMSKGFAPAVTLPLRGCPLNSCPGGACGIVMPPSPFA